MRRVLTLAVPVADEAEAVPADAVRVRRAPLAAVRRHAHVRAAALVRRARVRTVLCARTLHFSWAERTLYVRKLTIYITNYHIISVARD